MMFMYFEIFVQTFGVSKIFSPSTFSWDALNVSKIILFIFLFTKE